MSLVLEAFGYSVYMQGGPRGAGLLQTSDGRDFCGVAPNSHIEMLYGHMEARGGGWPGATPTLEGRNAFFYLLAHSRHVALSKTRYLHKFMSFPCLAVPRHLSCVIPPCRIHQRQRPQPAAGGELCLWARCEQPPGM